MPSKRTYRATKLQSLDRARLLERLEPDARVVVGLDVAKHKFLAAVTAGDEVVEVVRFQHPAQTRRFVGLLTGLVESGREVEVVLEPTGTYGDAVRHQLRKAGLSVYRVSTKHVSDAKEVFDGVPSKHDAKDACVIAWLHGMGRSAEWQPMSEARRRLRALVAQRDVHNEQLRRLRGRLEALLARFFPEFESFFDVARRKTPLKLLEEFRSPASLATAGPERVMQVVRSVRHRPVDMADIECLVEAAKSSVGLSMIEEEGELVHAVVTEMARAMDKVRQVDGRIAEVAMEEPAVAAMRPVLGATTAAVVVGYMGSPAHYGSAAAFEKAVGLNLTEHSSGKQKGGLHISKRGPSRVRQYLFLAAMRLIQADPVVRAWYQRRRAWTQQARLKAVIAVARKLTRSLVHVARGEPFDAARLFDVRRLGLGEPLGSAPLDAAP